jgi:hypothetical protein
MSPDAAHAVDQLIESAAPASLLCLGQDAETLTSGYAGRHPALDRRVFDRGDFAQQLAHAGQYDLAVIAGVLEQLDKRQAAIVLSRVRDLHARAMLLLVQVGPSGRDTVSQWERNDFIALGMELLGQFQDDDRSLHLYRFDIHTYKTTPDWLNAKYWAHPELWGKKWW